MQMEQGGGGGDRQLPLFPYYSSFNYINQPPFTVISFLFLLRFSSTIIFNLISKKLDKSYDKPNPESLQFLIAIIFLTCLNYLIFARNAAHKKKKKKKKKILSELIRKFELSELQLPKKVIKKPSKHVKM